MFKHLPNVGDKQFFFKQSVLLKVGRELHNTKDQFVKLFGQAVTRDVFEHYAGEVGQPVDKVGMVVRKVCGLWERLSAMSSSRSLVVLHCLKQREYVLFLKGKMVLHLTFVVGKELSEDGAIAVARMGGYVEKMALDVGQSLTEIVTVGGLQIGYKGTEVGGGKGIGRRQIASKCVDIENEQHKIDIKLITVADFLDALFAKAKTDAQARQDKQKGVIGSNNGGHLHFWGKQGLRHKGIWVKRICELFLIIDTSDTWGYGGENLVGYGA